MVQRKLTLQLHHAQTQTSFPHHHHHDSAAKSPRGADLKAKKMKKTASIKRPKTATPNYMKPTTSSDARKEQSQLQSQSRSPSPSSKKIATLTKKPSFKPSRKTVDAKAATCSSTLKDSKFPPFLSLNQNGHSAIKVCPYTYCSLNGHHHPPLSSFLSAARRARAPPARADDDDDDGFFVEIYTAAQDKEERVSEESSQDSFDYGSYMDWETGYGYGALLQYDYEVEDAVEIKHELVEDKDCCFDEVLIDEAAQESSDEDGGFNSDAFSSSDDREISTPLQQQEEEKEEEGNEEVASFDDLNQKCLPEEEAVAVAVEASGEAECSVFENAEDMITLLQFAASSRKIVEGDELGGFNPRAPNFLAVEADPEAERVDLRHQDLDERRNSEEWMVDYALRQVVTKLGPAKKRKVALLVEAFERVMPLPLPPTKFDLHLSHALPFDQPRPMQACS